MSSVFDVSIDQVKMFNDDREVSVLVTVPAGTNVDDAMDVIRNGSFSIGSSEQKFQLYNQANAPVGEDLQFKLTVRFAGFATP